MLRLEKRKKENLSLKQNHQKDFQNVIASKVTKLLDSNSDRSFSGKNMKNLYPSFHNNFSYKFE